MNKELQEILKLEGFKILKIDERKEKTKIIKVIYVDIIKNKSVQAVGIIPVVSMIN